MSATSSNTSVEICIETVASLRAALETRAQRVELCSSLFEGGLTPSVGLIQQCKRILDEASSDLKLFVLIRPRPGDFLYSPEEFEIMKLDIAAARSAGADGVVLGLLHADGHVDVPRTRELVQLARPMQVTFHRAFDMTVDPYRALEDLISMGGIQRILTSGQQNSALEGARLIADLVLKAGKKITIVAGGGITEGNVKWIAQLTSATEFHFSLRKKISSGMTYKNANVFMGGALRADEYSLAVADEAKIRTAKALLSAKL